MPEEINRVPTDHAANLLLAPAQVAAGVSEGSSPLARGARPCAGGRRAGPGSGLYSPAMIHRAENTDDVDRLRLVRDSPAGVNHPVALFRPGGDGGGQGGAPDIVIFRPLLQSEFF